MPRASISSTQRRTFAPPATTASASRLNDSRCTRLEALVVEAGSKAEIMASFMRARMYAQNCVRSRASSADPGERPFEGGDAARTDIELRRAIDGDLLARHVELHALHRRLRAVERDAVVALDRDIDAADLDLAVLHDDLRGADFERDRALRRERVVRCGRDVVPADIRRALAFHGALFVFLHRGDVLAFGG